MPPACILKCIFKSCNPAASSTASYAFHDVKTFCSLLVLRQTNLTALEWVWLRASVQSALREKVRACVAQSMTSSCSVLPTLPSVMCRLSILGSVSEDRGEFPPKHWYCFSDYATCRHSYRDIHKLCAM